VRDQVSHPYKTTGVFVNGTQNYKNGQHGCSCTCVCHVRFFCVHKVWGSTSLKYISVPIFFCNSKYGDIKKSFISYLLYKSSGLFLNSPFLCTFFM
jgi:hypothetical protein